MSKGISTAIAVDTRAFQSGVKSGVVEPLQSAEQTLQAITAAGDKAGSELERSFQEQQQATQHLKSEIDDLNTHIKQGSSSSSLAMRQNVHETATKVDEGFTEMKDSAKQNAIQTAASFNGSFDSLSGGVQGLVSEFAAGLGPAGLAAGVVGAAGIGLITTAVDGATQSTQADKQATADLAKQYMAAGTEGKRAFSDVSAALQDMATNTDGSAIITLQDAWNSAKVAGADYQSIVESIAQASPAQIQLALDKVNALRAGYQGALRTAADYAGDPNASLTPKIQAASKLADALGKAKKQATDAAHAQQLAADAGLSKFQQKSDLIDELTKGYADTAGSVTDFLNKESGIFETSKYIAAMQRRADEMDNYQKHLTEAQLTPEAKAFLDSQGVDAAAAMLDGFRHGSKAQQIALDHIWTTAGQKNVQSYNDAIGKGFNNLPTPPSIPAPRINPPSRQDLRMIRAAMQRYLDEHPLQARATGYTSYGKPLFGDQ